MQIKEWFSVNVDLERAQGRWLGNRRRLISVDTRRRRRGDKEIKIESFITNTFKNRATVNLYVHIVDRCVLCLRAKYINECPSKICESRVNMRLY